MFSWLNYEYKGETGKNVVIVFTLQESSLYHLIRFIMHRIIQNICGRLPLLIISHALISMEFYRLIRVTYRLHIRQRLTI